MKNYGSATTIVALTWAYRAKYVTFPYIFEASGLVPVHHKSDWATSTAYKIPTPSPSRNHRKTGWNCGTKPTLSVANSLSCHTCHTISKLALTISALSAWPNGKVEIIWTVFIYNITTCLKWIYTYSTAECKNVTNVTVVPVTVLNRRTDSLFPRFWLAQKVWAFQICMNEGFLTSSKRSSCYPGVKTHCKLTKLKTTWQTDVSCRPNHGNTTHIHGFGLLFWG